MDNQQRAVQEILPGQTPRNFLDAAVCTVVALVQIPLLIAIPGVLAYLLFPDLRVAAAAGIGFFLGIYLRHVVSKLELDDDGVHFVRKMGRPRFISWKDLKTARIASPAEIVVWGWFLPLFPAREMSTSFSMYGHVALRWGRRTVYFPPKDPDAFVQLVNERLEEVRGASPSAEKHPE